MERSLSERTREVIRANSVLGELPEEEAQRLGDRVRHFRYADGETIFTPHSCFEGLPIVLSGRVHHYSTSRTGSDILLHTTESGHVFGEISAIDQGKPQAIGLADGATEIVVIAPNDLYDLWRRFPKVALATAKRLCAHIRLGTEFIDDLALQDAGTRLFTRLMILSRAYGSLDEETEIRRIQHGLSQQELAESANLTRVSVNRQLADWKARGLVRSGKGFIEIPDLERLETYVWKQES